jgi:hypothetical protein
MNIMNQIVSIGFLLIICITVLLVAAPFIDHVFYVHHKIEEIEKYKLYLMIIVHVLLLGLLIIFIHYFIIEKYIRYFKITKYENYMKILIDLTITLSLIGLQRNLLFKIRYISLHHPIRSKLIE